MHLLPQGFRRKPLSRVRMRPGGTYDSSPAFYSSRPAGTPAPTLKKYDDLLTSKWRETGPLNPFKAANGSGVRGLSVPVFGSLNDGGSRCGARWFNRL